LDQAILNWNKQENLTLRHLLNGGVAVLGRAGSGKTSSTGRILGRSIVRRRDVGGLICAAKPDDLPMWREIFAGVGRRDDLLVFDAAGSLRCNFVEYEATRGGHTRNITKFITTIGESLGPGDARSGEHGEFFQREEERLLHSAVEVVKMATNGVNTPLLQRFILAAANSPDELTSDRWRGGLHNDLLAQAFRAQKTPVESHDYELAVDYWLQEYPAMAPRTRSSILTGVMGLLHTFNSGITRELVSTATNCSPDDILAGKWVLVNLPPSVWGDIGRLVAAGWKYLVQRAVLRREVTAESPAVVIWCDEAAQFVNSFDHHYLAQCRSYLGCMVYLAQSLHSYYSELKGEAGKHQAHALLANFGHKVIHALGDVQTAEWASGLVGKRIETFVGGSLAPAKDLFDAALGQTQFTGSFSTHYESVLQAHRFMNGLRTGGRTNRSTCDAFVIRSGEPFSDGDNWIKVAVSQK
jgi:hypothetical protein